MLIWAKTRKVRPSENRPAFGQIFIFFKKLFATVQHIGRRSRNVAQRLTFSQNWKKWLLCPPLVKKIEKSKITKDECKQLINESTRAERETIKQE